MLFCDPLISQPSSVDLNSIFLTLIPEKMNSRFSSITFCSSKGISSSKGSRDLFSLTSLFIMAANFIAFPRDFLSLNLAFICWMGFSFGFHSSSYPISSKALIAACCSSG
ncbi:unnamed protein product [Moneuplotes crassus]|uniref:Uncharacterized protein n=1 Tax=Euplotes crassus TaxID=5936 RepID=A0AAD1XNV1_EUPCR|nr:unnamed protein product [Moneuplotes crassus]